MPLIKIISPGTYGHRQGMLVVGKTSADEPFEVTKDEANRAVARKIAKIVDTNLAGNKVDELSGIINQNDNVETQNTELQAGDDKDIVYTAEDLEELKAPKLREIAEEMGLEIQLFGVSNASIIEAILEAQNTELLTGGDDGVVE